MKKFDETPPKIESLELDLPDWSGMGDSPRRISAETAYRLCEEYRTAFPKLASNWESERQKKNGVEFKL